MGFKNTSTYLYYSESQCDSICRNGNFQDSVRCLRGLHSSCQDPVKLEMLKKYADPNAWEAGFNRLCHSMSRKYRNITDCTSTLGFTKCRLLILKHVCVFLLPACITSRDIHTYHLFPSTCSMQSLYQMIWYLGRNLISWNVKTKVGKVNMTQPDSRSVG